MAERKAVGAKKVKAAPKPAAARKPAPVAAAARGPNEKRYWLVKTEPEVFSFASLQQAPGSTSGWDGVRNYQARNFMRDLMKVGDGVLVYHSNADPPAIAGFAVIAREGYVDPTQFDRKHHHYDPDSKPDNPAWYQVDIKAVRPLKRQLGLPELKTMPGLEGMVLVQKGSRLSVQPVSAAEWAIIEKLGG